MKNFIETGKGGKRTVLENKILEGEEAHILQVGVVVKDLDKTVEFLTSIGLGPFTIREVVHPRADLHKKKVSYQVKLAITQQGPVQLELIEYKRGETIHKEFLDERGEGLHHIQFQVRNIQETLEKFSKKGILVLQADKFVGGGGLAYMGTDMIGGIIIEIVQRPPNYDPRKGVRYE